MTFPTGGTQGATPATSIWLVIGDLPGETDEQRKTLENLKAELAKEVEKKVRDTLGQFQSGKVRPPIAGIAKTRKLRIFVEEM